MEHKKIYKKYENISKLEGDECINVEVESQHT